LVLELKFNLGVTTYLSLCAATCGPIVVNTHKLDFWADTYVCLGYDLSNHNGSMTFIPASCPPFSFFTSLADGFG